MTFLVDANVLSEPTRPALDPGVLAWQRQHERDLVVDPMIVGERRFGILLLPKGRKRARLEGVEDQVRRAISPPMPELQLDLSVPGHAHAVSRHRRTQGVPAHPFESLPLAGRHDEARMEIEAVRSRMTTAERGRLNRLGRVTQTTDPRAPLPPQRHGAVRGHRRQSSQHRRLVRPRVGLASAVVAIPEAPPLEQAPDARLHRGI